MSVRDKSYLFIFFTPYHLSQVSSAASKTNLTETSQYSSQCQIFSNKAHDIDTLPTDRTELFVTEHCGSCEADSDVTLIKQTSFPEEQCKQLSFDKREDCDSANYITVTQESDSHVYQERLDDLNILSPEYTSTSPKSESSEPKQLERMEPLYRTEDESPDYICKSSGDDENSRFESTDITEHKTPSYQAYRVPIGQEQFHTSIQEELKITIPNSDITQETDLSFVLDSDKESPSIPTAPLTHPELAQTFCEVREPSLNATIPSDIFQSDLNNQNSFEPSAPASFLEHITKEEPETSEKHFIDLPGGSTAVLQLGDKEFEDELFTSASVVNENMSRRYSENQQLDFTEESSLKTTQNEEFSSLSDVTPETVTDARHFIFEEFIPQPSSELNESYSNHERPQGEDSEDQRNVNPGCFTSTVTPKQEIPLLTSEENGCITSQYAETGTTTSSYIPPKYFKGVPSGVESLANECSDQEPYFDCKQAESDFSETEPDESDPKVNCRGYVPLSQVSNPTGHQKTNQRIVLSSGSEEFDDAYIVHHEPLCNVDEEEEELLHHTETSEDEFTLCEASQPPALCSESDDTDKYLTRVR